MTVNATPINGTTTISPTDEEDEIVLLGWSVREVDTSSGVVVGNFHAGTSTSGARKATIQMPPGGESQTWLWPGVRCGANLHFNLIAGGVFGVVYWRGSEQT